MLRTVQYTASGLVLLVLLTRLSAQPAKPEYPKINPPQARLDQTATGLDAPGHALTYCKQSGLLIAASENRCLRYWRKDVAMGVRVGSRPTDILQGHDGPVLDVVARAGTVASIGVQGTLLVWQLPENKVKHTIEVGALTRALAVSPDGKLLATGSDDGIVRLWDATTGKVIRELKDAKNWLLALAFSADGKQLAAGGYSGSWYIWDVAGGKKLREGIALPKVDPKNPPPTNVVQSLAFSPDGKILAVGGSDAKVHFFQTADGKFTRTLNGHTSSVTALAYHPSGTLLASSSKDRTLKLWNPANGQLFKTLEGHESWVQDITFLIQGSRLASVGADRTVRLWDLTDPAN